MEPWRTGSGPSKPALEVEARAGAGVRENRSLSFFGIGPWGRVIAGNWTIRPRGRIFAGNRHVRPQQQISAGNSSGGPRGPTFTGLLCSRLLPKCRGPVARPHFSHFPPFFPFPPIFPIFQIVPGGKMGRGLVGRGHRMDAISGFAVIPPSLWLLVSVFLAPPFLK